MCQEINGQGQSEMKGEGIIEYDPHVMYLVFRSPHGIIIRRSYSEAAGKTTVWCDNPAFKSCEKVRNVKRV